MVSNIVSKINKLIQKVKIMLGRLLSMTSPERKETQKENKQNIELVKKSKLSKTLIRIANVNLRTLCT